MEMMALDDQPFTIVEDTAFCWLVNYLEPRFVLPSRHYFSDVCLPAMTQVMCDVGSVNLLGLTVQWLDKDFKLYRAALYAQELPSSHTAMLICEAFEYMLQQWNITKEMAYVVL